MPKKPPTWDQPTLFPLNPNDVIKPEKAVSSTNNGDDHAIQNDRARNAEGPEGTPRAAPPDPQANADDGAVRPRTEGEPRAVEGDPGSPAAGERSGTNRERGTGTGPQGTGGSFALHVESTRRRPTFTRPGDGFRPESFAERLRPARGQGSLFNQPRAPSTPPADT